MGKSKNEVELNEKMYSADHDLDLDHEADKSGCCKIMCRGVATCPVISLLFLAIILLLGAIGFILAGPTCNCEYAVPFYREQLENSSNPIAPPPPPVSPLPDPPPVVIGTLLTMKTGHSLLQEDEIDIRCEQCPFFWTQCVLNGIDTMCGRGCAMAASYDNGVSYADPICLRHNFGDVLLKDWSEISIFQIVGFSLIGVCVIVFVIAFVVSYTKGKKLIL